MAKTGKSIIQGKSSLSLSLSHSNNINNESKISNKNMQMICIWMKLFTSEIPKVLGILLVVVGYTDIIRLSQHK